MKFSIDRFKVGQARKTICIYTFMSSKLTIIIVNRDYSCSFSVKNCSALAVVKKNKTPTSNWMLGVIRKGLWNRPENLIMLCINPCCVHILNIADNFGGNSRYLVERKEDAGNRNEDDQKLNSVFI